MKNHACTQHTMPLPLCLPATGCGDDVVVCSGLQYHAFSKGAPRGEGCSKPFICLSCSVLMTRQCFTCGFVHVNTLVWVWACNSHNFKGKGLQQVGYTCCTCVKPRVSATHTLTDTCCVCAVCCLPVVTVAGLALWIITVTLGTTRAQQQCVVLPHAVQLFVSNSQYSESAIRVGLADTTTSTQHRRATPSELAWLKQHGAATNRSTLITLVSLSKCLEVGRHFGVPNTILDQLRQQLQAVSLPTTAMAAAPAPPQPITTTAPTGINMPRQYNNTAAINPKP